MTLSKVSSNTSPMRWKLNASSMKSARLWMMRSIIMYGKNHCRPISDTVGAILPSISLSCCECYDTWSYTSHQHCGCGVQSRCAIEEVDCKTYEESVDHQAPFRGIERQNHHIKHVNARMYKVSKPDVVDNQHLEDKQSYKT